MKKLTLSLESLTVESFDTLADRTATRGTVLGNSGEVPIGDSAAECGYNTEGPTCGPENTCGYYYETCQETYQHSCAPCDASNWCNTDAGLSCEYC